MKKNTLKVCCASLASALFVSSVPFIQSSNIKASNYRTEYTIYGDINGDKVIDSFDIIAIKKKIAAGKYDKLYDLNCDKKLDDEDAKLLQHYVLGDKTVFDAYYCEDTDGDEISDFTEITDFGTDPDSADTDNDGLTDLEEIINTQTSPLDKFSNGTNISDGEFDSDSDGINNKDEVKLGTDPLNEDTDYDGLSDSEEINKHKTDPLNYDSDGDFIPDGDEVILSYDPNKKSTDGIKNDNEIITDQVISADSEALKVYNTNSAFAEMSVNVSASGLAENSLIVRSSKYKNIIDKDSDVDKAFELEYNKNLKVNNLRLNFKVKEVSDLKDYMIFRFYPEYNVLLPLETKYDYESKTLYTILDDFSSLSELGTFKIININEYVQNINTSFQNTFSQISNEIEGIKRYSRVIYDGADPDKYSSYDEAISDLSRKEAILCDISQYIFALDSNNFSAKKHDLDMIYVFNGNNEYTGVDFNISDNNDELKNVACTPRDIDTLKANLNEENYGFVNKTRKYVFEHKDHSYVVNLALGWAQVVNKNYSFGNNTSSNYCIVLSNRVPEVDESVYKEIYNYGLKFYFIVPDYSSSSKKAIELAEKYGNKIYSYDNYQLIFSDILEEKLEKSNISLNNRMMVSEIPEKIKRADFIAMLPKLYNISKIPSCDENGEIDFYDACLKIGLAEKDSYGNIKFKSLYDFSSDRKETQNGLKQLKEFMSDEQFQVLSKMNMIPYFDIPEYKNQITDPEYSTAFELNGKTFCYPPTYYSEIIPENYAIHEEGVNGETIDGTWVSWY